MLESYFIFSCISFDSYIKPQLSLTRVNIKHVVYLLIPTSNHNLRRSLEILWFVVYLLIPTSNHNMYDARLKAFRLYIFWFLHQTTTVPQLDYSHVGLYIFWFLHQTTTECAFGGAVARCISFDSYIKPQLFELVYEYINVVYLLIPTSNHNWHRRTDLRPDVVYLLIPTSNHNVLPTAQFGSEVVYLLIPTSNHNQAPHNNICCGLYIFWFLHQTTTMNK